MSDGITVHILGDFGPFSDMGKSIGYQITIGKSRYILDCGSPLFQQIGSEGLKNIDGLIITHCHDDHKRWFTDLALFNMYTPEISERVSLITSEVIHQELIRGSGPALDKSLSPDSKEVIDIAYEDYVYFKVLGPQALYRIVSTDQGKGVTRLSIVDRSGNTVDSDRAKIIINPKTRRPRMLFKDPQYGEWIEPESFYPFSSNVFYEEDKNIFRDSQGFTIQAIKAHMWHGISGIGLKFQTKEETLIFSSDTVHDVDLWKELYTEKRTQRLSISEKEFEAAPVIYGDINDFIERIWSEERYSEALSTFDDAVVIHDVSARSSVVHTDYEKLDRTSLRKEKVILTHCPDEFTSEWALCETEKVFRIKGDRYYEVVGDEFYSMNADVYRKKGGKYYVGYRNDEGKYTVYKKDGLLGISGEKDTDAGNSLYRIDLYEDIYGKYFPTIEDKNTRYLERDDGQVERIEFSDDGSTGRVVENQRSILAKRKSVVPPERK
jgi:hypothetical protein